MGTSQKLFYAGVAIVGLAAVPVGFFSGYVLDSSRKYPLVSQAINQPKLTSPDRDLKPIIPFTGIESLIQKYGTNAQPYHADENTGRIVSNIFENSSLSIPDQYLALASENIIAAKFSAAWCGPCLVQEPAYKAAVENSGIAAITIDAEEDGYFVNNSGKLIKPIPTYVIFKRNSNGSYAALDETMELGDIKTFTETLKKYQKP